MTPQALTPEQLVELRELEKQATPGPWVVRDDDGPTFIGASAAKNGYVLIDTPPRTAAFVVAMRNAIPSLLDELESLRAEVERLRRVISGTHQAYCDKTRARHAPECLLFEIEEQP